MCDHDARDAFMVMKLWTSWKEHANVARLRRPRRRRREHCGLEIVYINMLSTSDVARL